MGCRGSSFAAEYRESTPATSLTSATSLNLPRLLSNLRHGKPDQKVVVEDPEYIAEKDRRFIESLDENALRSFVADTDGDVATTVACHASFEAFADDGAGAVQEGFVMWQRQSSSKAMNTKLAANIIQIDSTMSGIGVACRKGMKQDGPNQDAWVVLNMDTYSIYGVFDGHGKSGNSMSNFVKEALLWIIAEDARLGSTSNEDVLQMLHEAHTRTQNMISAATKMKKIDATYSGSTSTLVIHDHIEDVLYVSWLGHSGATLGRLGVSQTSPQRTRRHSRRSRSSLGSLDTYQTQNSPGNAAQNSRRSSLGSLDSHQTQNSPSSPAQQARHSRNSRGSLGSIESHMMQNSPRSPAQNSRHLRNSRSSLGSSESYKTQTSLGSTDCVLPISLFAELHLTSYALTWDHRPELPIERSRIEKMGGSIVLKPSCLPNGNASYHVFAPARTYPQHGLIPALQVMSYPATDSSRTFGDLMGHADAGLIAEPSQKVHKLGHEDKILLVCSDGVWDVLTEEEAVKIVMEFTKNQAMTAAQTLAVEARSRWMGKGEPDDITTIVIYLD